MAGDAPSKHLFREGTIIAWLTRYGDSDRTVIANYAWTLNCKILFVF